MQPQQSFIDCFQTFPPLLRQLLVGESISPLATITLPIEVVEETEVDWPLRQDGIDQAHVVASTQEERGDGVHPVHHELHHLQLGEVSLPPEVGLDGRAERGQAKVAEHGDVRQRVDHGVQRGQLEGGVEAEGEIGEEDHRTVVVDVQHTQATLLLAQHMEKGVDEIEILGQQVQMAKVNVGQRGRTLVAGVGTLKVEKFIMIVDQKRPQKVGIEGRHEEIVDT